MLKKTVIFILVICLSLLITSCAVKYYAVNNIDGQIVSIAVSDLNSSQKKIIKQYDNEDIEILDVIKSGEFTADELADFGLINRDSESGDPVLEGGSFAGIPDIDPNLLIKVISGQYTQDDIQALFDAGMTEQDINALLPVETSRTVDPDGNELPPSD